MASEREEFSLCGPLHLTTMDWSNSDHRRSVAACLVQGIYIVERDRQLKREGSQSLASPWWQFFHFKLLRHLIDDVDFSIFGGLYEYKPPPSDDINSLDQIAPRYVIAFRGTLTKPDSVSRDLELDIHMIRNGLHKTTRFEIAMQAVRNVVASVGASNVWLAGHSLGAAMALLAGKTIGKTGVYLESHIFNPPFLSPPIERIKNENVRHGIRIAGSVITAGLALARQIKEPQVQQQQQQRNGSGDSFVVLSSWIPYLYVNPGDHLCMEYIGYFEHRNKMEEIGAKSIERLATKHSLGGFVMSAMGMGDGVLMEEPLHVIPSANLTVNQTDSDDFREAHGIHQWWRQDQVLESKLYLYEQ